MKHLIFKLLLSSGNNMFAWFKIKQCKRFWGKILLLFLPFILFIQINTLSVFFVYFQKILINYNNYTHTETYTNFQANSSISCLVLGNFTDAKWILHSFFSCKIFSCVVIMCLFNLTLASGLLSDTGLLQTML